jgi:UV DNA damage repair endonuclease
MPSSYALAPFIEIEAKAKEEAIQKLGRWPHQAQ